jgi:hypothetical protein
MTVVAAPDEALSAMEAVVGYAAQVLRGAVDAAARRRGANLDPVRSLFVVEREVAAILDAGTAAVALVDPGELSAHALPAPLGALTDFERSTLQLLAGIELIPRVDRVVGFLQDDLTRRGVTVGLLIDMLANGTTDRVAARAAFAPSSMLRRLHLVAYQPSNEPLADSVRIDGAFLARLCGSAALDQRVSAIATRVIGPVGSSGPAGALPAPGTPMVFWGAPAEALADESSAAASGAGLPVVRIDGELAGAIDGESLGIAAREALCDGALLAVAAPSPHVASVAARSLAGLPVRVIVEAPGGIAALGELPHRRIATVARRDVTGDAAAIPLPFGRRIVARRGLDRLILPSSKLRALHAILHRVECRDVVFGEWGLESGSSVGGVRVLFAGPPGTGKTLAAEAIASHLGRDLYVVDISAVVSKYIGETEKLLSQVFAEAAKANVCLFFDEADALFGKRGEQKDAHDKYANIETAFLLQAVDAYPDLVVLATNMPDNVDDALSRRIDVRVEFGMPDAAARERLWRTALADAPYDDTSIGGMAERFVLSGGSIQNAALAAAYTAAAERRGIAAIDLVRAARDELAKSGRVAGRLELGADYAELMQEESR